MKSLDDRHELPEHTLRQIERANSKVGPRELLALAQDRSFAMQLQANGVDPSGLTREQKYAAWVNLELTKISGNESGMGKQSPAPEKRKEELHHGIIELQPTQRSTNLGKVAGRHQVKGRVY